MPDEPLPFNVGFGRKPACLHVLIDQAPLLVDCQQPPPDTSSWSALRLLLGVAEHHQRLEDVRQAAEVLPVRDRRLEVGAVLDAPASRSISL